MTFGANKCDTKIKKFGKINFWGKNLPGKEVKLTKGKQMEIILSIYRIGLTGNERTYPKNVKKLLLESR